ncbi:MAG: hypothetical protein FJ290_05505 [Planctomycetes bacterium]|nr:hypothetical protein [Planctomycetota bacterium]
MAVRLAAWLFLSASTALSAEHPLLGHFRGEPADSLIRQLEPPAAPPKLPEGLVLRQETRWLPDLGFALIETTLVNEGKGEAKATSVPLADWTFRVGAAADSAYRPLAYRNDTWYGSTYWTGPDWTRVGRDWQHPGENTASVRRFTCPRDGTVTITGRVAKAHVDPKTDGVRVIIRHSSSLSLGERAGVRVPEQENTLWQTELDGGDAKGLEPKLTLDVRKGDALRFIVHKRGQIFCDTTRWDPAIAYADGESFLASKGFSTQKQGDGGWSYEMEGGPQNKAGLPTVYSFPRHTDGRLRRSPMDAGRGVGFCGHDDLPLLVIADGVDQSGIVLAAGPDKGWEAKARLGRDGRLSIGLLSWLWDEAQVLKPGQSQRLPTLFLGAYRGPWLVGVAQLERLVDSEGHGPALRKELGSTGGVELYLSAMVQAEWYQEDRTSGKDAAVRQVEKARLLLAGLQRGQPAGFLAEEAASLSRLAAAARDPESYMMDPERLYHYVHWLKRRIALANPLLPRAPLLFVKRVPTSYSHLVMQYFGWRARPGGGIFVLEEPGRSLKTRCLFDASAGNALEPRLSYDAKRVVFSYSKCTKEDPFYHIYEMNVDGTGLRQLTSGEFEDLMPCYLPDGGIVFSSTRRKGHARCFGGQFGPRWHVYTLHRMDADGSNLRTLSFHETNEWFPTVAPSGYILYSRWDYVDRHPVVHQNLWACRPDGTNPVALWGNHTQTPHCTFQLQPIPGTSKVAFTASAHHSITGGSIAIVDTRLGANGEHALTRITPEVKFPEAEGGIQEYYDSPWPLSEDFFLVGYSPKPLVMEPGANDPAALGIYLLDRWGNRELLYRDPEIGSSNPIPIVPRPVPPILTSAVQPDDPPTGEMVLLDVYEGLGGVPRGSVKALRIVQILPKTTPVADAPRIGLAGQEPARAVLGTVPVEADGSARFTVPARKPVYFQALDADGFAIQSMRSITYAQPGERATCIGCHEHRMTAPPSRLAQALLRTPSAIEPGPDGTRPFSYVCLVQPVLDRHCVRCHSGDKPAKGLDFTGTPHDGFTRSYWVLCGGLSFWHGGTNAKNAAEALVPRYGGWNPVHRTEPGGAYGARGSRLMKALLKCPGADRPPADALGRLALWIDLNAVFYGVYDPAAQARQLRGEAVEMPEVQ